MHVCTHMPVRAYVCVNVCMYMREYRCMYYVCAGVYVPCALQHTCIHMYVYMYVYMCICIHASMQACRSTYIGWLCCFAYRYIGSSVTPVDDMYVITL